MKCSLGFSMLWWAARADHQCCSRKELEIEWLSVLLGQPTLIERKTCIKFRLWQSFWSLIQATFTGRGIPEKSTIFPLVSAISTHILFAYLRIKRQPLYTGIIMNYRSVPSLVLLKQQIGPHTRALVVTNLQYAARVSVYILPSISASPRPRVRIWILDSYLK